MGNGLELLLAHVVVGKIGLSRASSYTLLGNADPSRICETFQTRSYVDAIAIDATFIINDIAQVDADPVLHLSICFGLGVPRTHRVDGDRTFNGIPNAIEFSEDAIACSVQ